MVIVIKWHDEFTVPHEELKAELKRDGLLLDWVEEVCTTRTQKIALRHDSEDYGSGWIIKWNTIPA